MERSVLYQRSDIHLSEEVKQRKASSDKDNFVQVRGNKDQGADNATKVSKQKEKLAIYCKKLKAKEDLSTEEIENIVNCLEQYVPPAKRVKREEIDDLIYYPPLPYVHLSNKETEDNVNFLKQFVAPAQRLKREEIGDMLKVIYNKMLDDEETVNPTRAMINSGITLRWPADWIVFEKHSTDRVCDKVSLVLAPVLAACGLKVLIISDRAQQHTGRAFDRLESLPGFYVMQEDADMRQILNDVGCCIVSQTSQLIPADKIMYAIRDATPTVHEHGLVTGSIISKKSQDSVGFDVRLETGTFCKDRQAIKMVRARSSLQIETITLLTHLSSTPLGKTFGNALEVAECIQCLQGKGPKDLTELVKHLGGQLLVGLKKTSSLEQAYEMIDETLNDDKSDNSAIVKFKAMIEAQGVDQYYAKRLCDKNADVFDILSSTSVRTTESEAKTSGCIQGINVLKCKKVMETLRSSAYKVGNSDCNTVGLKLLVSIGDEIEEGWPWIKIYHNGELSEELVEDINGAIEIYQDPTEPNKRRTDYENEEESKEYKQKKKEFSDIRIKEIKIEVTEFPRYEYALSNLLDVVMRYKNVLQSSCIGQDGRYILFYICTTPENEKIVDDFLQEISKKGEIRDGGSLEQFVQTIDQSAISCFITPVNYQHILTAIRHRTAMTFILGDTDLEEENVIQRCQNTYDIHINNTWKQIDSVLEKWLFQSLRPVCGALGRDIERNRFDKNTTDKDEYEEKSITDDGQTNETNVIIFLKKDMLSTLKTETKDCLFEEIIGLFNMSDVSTDDIPNIPKYRSDLDLKEICRHLSSTFKDICGVGCRMQKLQIVVKDVQSFTTEEMQNRLRQVLHDFKIYEYELVPMSIKKYLTPGDSIAVGNVRSGSFGCFAKENNTQNDETVMYGLFSKHLVPSSEQINVLHVMEGGEPKSVGKIIGSTVEGGKLDIAAAALSIRKDECDARFKTARGKQISGEIRIIEPEKLRGRKVHIWGAKSKPGIGIITVPEHSCTGMDYTLILVEDIADGEGNIENLFAQPGDSGAIACTDGPGQEYVIPISMMIGEYTEKDGQNVERKTYATVPLQSGLRQISEMIGKKVELCFGTGH